MEGSIAGTSGTKAQHDTNQVNATVILYSDLIKLVAKRTYS